MRSCWSTPDGSAACRRARPASRAKQLLDVLDLAEDAKRLVADYSTGMRKKAMLGCALIHNPVGAVPGRAARRRRSGLSADAIRGC